MAKFNEKVLCLFNKDYKQLKKEAERRGMCHDGREKTIAKIIWKDAYDAGVIEGIVEGKNRSALGRVMPNCPATVAAMRSPKRESTVLKITTNQLSTVLNSPKTRPEQFSGLSTTAFSREK